MRAVFVTTVTTDDYRYRCVTTKRPNVFNLLGCVDDSRNFTPESNDIFEAIYEALKKAIHSEDQFGSTRHNQILENGSKLLFGRTGFTSCAIEVSEAYLHE